MDEGTQVGPERERFAVYLSQHRTRLFGYIHALVRNLADAEDVFQQTALALWRRFDVYDPNRCFLRWACGIARLEAATWLRARARERLRFSDALTLTLLDAFVDLTDEEPTDRQAALAGCLDKLPEPDRRLVTECYLQEPDVARVAGRLGRPARSVYNSLRRIRRTLYECIERTVARGGRV
jgi:RNA polymerase sigma-70 factor (ECF subfamily)